MRSQDPLILLVEDDPDDEEFVRRAIRKSGIHVRLEIVRDGVEALEFLQASGKRSQDGLVALPTLVLLDLNMPRMGGLELLRRLRATEATRHLPIVIFTSSSEEHDVWASYRAGASSFVRKPVEWDQFQTTVRHIGEYWLDVNRPPPARLAGAAT